MPGAMNLARGNGLVDSTMREPFCQRALAAFCAGAAVGINIEPRIRITHFIILACTHLAAAPRRPSPL
jgi:hypothetical protein